eukprot:TRINITY_DN5267_c0_g1_i1.p1 TRINITY_DN5267_c0_g1~~TRINITY_DN5267_c0_g1_i1.p1  ORF type:complete len:162 (-),score=29.23 TRINITY_DN5267_c0_g1_i1:27-512(-)
MGFKFFYLRAKGMLHEYKDSSSPRKRKSPFIASSSPKRQKPNPSSPHTAVAGSRILPTPSPNRVLQKPSPSFGKKPSPVFGKSTPSVGKNLPSFGKKPTPSSAGKTVRLVGPNDRVRFGQTFLGRRCTQVTIKINSGKEEEANSCLWKKEKSNRTRRRPLV